MSNFNMTGDDYPHNFDGDLSQFKKEEPKQELEPYKIGIGSIILYFVIGLLIGAVLILDNKNDALKAKLVNQANLKARIAEQDTLIRDLKTVLDDDLKMHHKNKSNYGSK